MKPTFTSVLVHFSLQLSVDFEWNDKNEWQWEQADLEFGGSSDTLLMNGHCNDERLKMDLDTGHDNGEKECALDDLVENCKSLLYNLDEVKMESGNKELNFLPDELVSAELQHEGAANELSEFGTKNCDFIGSQEKEVSRRMHKLMRTFPFSHLFLNYMCRSIIMTLKELAKRILPMICW